jgi:two-component system sensor histidine kinase KdpD
MGLTLRYSPRSTPSRVLWTLGVVAGAMLAGILLQRGFGVERISMLFLAAVLLCAAWFGVWYGLVASLASTAGLSLIAAETSNNWALGGKQDLVNLVVCVLGAWVAGLYVDERRRERDALLRLAGSDRRFGADLVMRLRAASPRWQLLGEGLRIVASLAITLGAVGIGAIVERIVGATAVSMIYLAGVVLAGSWLGVRYGLVTAIAGALAYDYFVAIPRFTLTLDSMTVGLNLIVFLAVGWQVGRFAERTRDERRAVRSLFDAGRSFSGTADEPELRRLIADFVAAVSGARQVVVRDEVGVVAAEYGAGVTPPRLDPDAPDGLGSAGPWRIRRLGTRSEPLGSVAWMRAGGEDDRPLDATADVLIDLGGAAVARARLNAEHLRLAAAAEAEQLRRALLASVSHDLRTPLAGILGSAESLLDHGDKYSEDVRRDLLLNVREQAHRLSRYVENLLGMTRLESGTLAPRVQAVALEPLILESWEAIAAGAGGVWPDLQVAEDAWALADPTLLRQVLSNLLENAVKYSRPGSPVEVTSARSGDRVTLVVRDHGPGVSEEEIQHLFEPFVRGRNSKPGGVGLGLFIARSFLEAMGGAIRAKPRRDGRSGLAVEVNLPAAGTMT